MSSNSTTTVSIPKFAYYTKVGPIHRKENKASQQSVSLPKRMAMSACAGMGATTFTQPLDVLKIQLQTASKQGTKLSTWVAAQQTYRAGGIPALYAGLSAAYLRQWMYGSGRMGIYSYLFNQYKQQYSATPSFGLKMAMGATSGSIGAFIGTPADVAIVRMSKNPKAYTSVFNCLTHIVQTEGFTSMYRGALVTTMRAAVMGSCLMGITSQTRQAIGSRGLMREDGIPIVFTSAACASVVACSVAMPLDVIKSRVQNMPKAGTAPLYNGMVDCAIKTVQHEGATALWKGFTPAMIKLAPYTVLSLTILEKITCVVTGTKAM